MNKDTIASVLISLVIWDWIKAISRGLFNAAYAIYKRYHSTKND
jgi:hypothetical protein